MLDINKHKFHLIRILQEIYNNKLSLHLGFKGGTAAYLFYDLSRFSTDLDFDFIYLKDEDSTLAINILREELNDLIEKNYEIKNKSFKQNTLFWLISYERNQMNIKIEINTRKFPNTYEMKNFYGSSIQLLKINDMIAHKLVATIDRKEPANRDLFDIDFFLKSKYATDINYDIITYRTGLQKKEFFGKLLTHINQYNSKNILFGLGELLTQNQKQWVKEKLLTELKNLILIQLDLN